MEWITDSLDHCVVGLHKEMVEQRRHYFDIVHRKLYIDCHVLLFFKYSL